MGSRKTTNALFKYRGISIFETPTGLRANCRKPGWVWVQFLQQLESRGLGPRLYRQGAYFDSLPLPELESLFIRPNRRRGLRALALVPLIAVLPLLWPSANGKEPQVTPKSNACIETQEAAKEFAGGESGSFEKVKSLTFGGITVERLSSTCGHSQYDITLTGEPMRVMAVKEVVD